MFKKEDYEYWGLWKQPVLSAWLWIDWHLTPSLSEMNIDNLNIHPFLYLDGHFWTNSVDRGEVLGMARRIVDEGGSEKYLGLIEKVFNRYKQACLSVLDLSGDDPHVYVEKLFEASRNMAAIWAFANFFADEFGKIALDKKIVKSEKELMDAVHQILPQTWIGKHGSEIDTFSRQVRLLGGSSISLDFVKEHADLKNGIENHVKEFSWFGTHHWMGEGYSLEKCLEQINDSLKKPEERNEKFDGDLGVNVDAVLRVISSGTFWRSHCAEIIAKIAYESRGILRALGEKAGLSYDDLIYLSVPEILSLGAGLNGIVFQEAIEERKTSGYGCVYTNDGMEIIVGEDLKLALAQMLSVEEEGVQEFRGSVACKGTLLRGIVKIVLAPGDFGKLEPGEILVAPETTPDFVPLMRRALAIITDRGGITSHAAIVSRELKKPCIIGTQNATSILRDGDLVEVDAEQGIVRILS